MQIVGHGFVAKSVQPIADRHPGIVVFAAGVSSGAGASNSEFAREADLLYATAERCRRTGRRLVYFSSSSVGVYGIQGRPCREDGPVYPRSPYGRHKLVMEEVIRNSGADHLILRLSYPVGHLQPHHQLIPSLVEQIGSGHVHLRLGARRDLIDVRHVVQMLDELLRLGVSREVVNMASGTAVPIAEIVDWLEFRLATTAEHHIEHTEVEDPISIDKLRRLVPAVDRMGFGAGYYRSVIDGYLYRTVLRPRRAEEGV